MSNDSLSCLVVPLVCLGFLVIAALTLVSASKRFGKFSAGIKAKKRGWDAFAARTNLQWESQTTLTTPTSNPVMDKFFGGDAPDKTGRVIGAYRGYPVVLTNETRQALAGESMMVTRQTYFTVLHLTIRNPADVSLRISKKDRHKLTHEPQELGVYLLDASHAYERLVQLPASFWINVQQQNLTYVQDGLENDEDRLYDILETMCDLADALGSCSAP